MFIGDRERDKLNLPKKKVIPTLAEYARTYLEFYKVAKERTLATKKSLINSLVKYLGNYQLDKLTPFIVEKFRVEYKEKDGVKDGTINDCISTLSHLFNIAIKAEIVDDNPCRDIKRFKVSQTRSRVLTTGEIALLLEKLQGKDRLMTLVSVLTGMRLNEVLKLQWQDIDFTKGLITFIQSKTWKLVTVPLSSYLTCEFQKYRATHSKVNLFEDKPVTKAVATAASNHFAKSRNMSMEIRHFSK